MKSTLHTLFALLLSIGLFANNTPPAVLKIKGVVIDGNSNSKLGYATVSLLSLPDSNLVTGAITDDQGKFEIKGIEKGKYTLKVSFLGYESVYQNLGEISKSVDIGEITISESGQKLEAVTITGEQRAVEVKIDKKVYNVEKDLNNVGANALEALNNAPSVTVDVDGVVSLRGDEGVRILINGRPLNIPIKQFLESTPASQIEKIEVITNPSAKYNPEGTSGLINIILKKNNKAGINGNLNLGLGYGIYAKNNNSLNLNLQKGKFNSYINYGYGNNKRWNGGTTDRSYYPGDTTTVYQFIEDEGTHHSKSHNLKIGTDYFANDKNVFYLSYGIFQNQTDGQNIMDSKFSNDRSYSSLNSYSIRESDLDRRDLNHNINLGWQKKFDKDGHTLDLDVNYDKGENINEEFNHEDFYLSDATVPFDFRENNQYQRDNTEQLFAKLDYVLPINDSLNLEAGLNYTVNKPGYLVEREKLDSNGVFVSDSAFNNAFNFDRKILALYSTLSWQRNKFGYKLGLRLENTTRNSELSNGESLKLDYLSLFPSLYVTYNIKQGQEIQISGSRRLQRPWLGQLNPFFSSTDPYNRNVGNPYLRPEFIYIGEMGYNQYWKKFTLNASVYYRWVDDLMRRQVILTDDGVSEVRFKNQSSATVYGSELIATYTPNKKMRFMVNFNSWNTQFDLDSTDTGNGNGVKGYAINANGSYRFESGISLQANVRHRSGMEVQQGRITPMTGLDLSARMPVLKGKGNVSVRVTDIFNTRQFGFTSENLGYNFDIDRRWESQAVYVNFSYNFGKQLNQRRRQQNRGGEQNVSTPGF